MHKNIKIVKVLTKGKKINDGKVWLKEMLKITFNSGVKDMNKFIDLKYPQAIKRR